MVVPVELQKNSRERYVHLIITERLTLFHCLPIESSPNPFASQTRCTSNRLTLATPSSRTARVVCSQEPTRSWCLSTITESNNWFISARHVGKRNFRSFSDKTDPNRDRFLAANKAGVIRRRQDLVRHISHHSQCYSTAVPQSCLGCRDRRLRCHIAGLLARCVDSVSANTSIRAVVIGGSLTCMSSQEGDSQLASDG
jgi:hypothetical protein